MRVLVLGSGAREHALVWKLSQSPNLTALGCAPGNVGMEPLATRVPVKLEDPNDVVRAAREFKAELVVVGPELPLVHGAVDALEDSGILAFGPKRGAALLEGSKAFAKEVMVAANVATASSEVFEDMRAAEDYARQKGRVVVKADGLAAGKGVVVAMDADEAVAAVRALGRGEAGRRLVLEEVLQGEELSMIALCDGERFTLLPPAQDHKRVGDNDTGPNTGGMGAFTPVERYQGRVVDEVGRTIIAPVLTEMAKSGRPFKGALYAGLMMTPSGPKVIEFNCRLGDPEAQVQLVQLEEDLLPLLVACAQGRLSARPLRLKAGFTVGVVLAAEGYPGAYKSGDVIEGLDRMPEGAHVFEAGTDRRGGQRVTAGGRVLTVCASGSTVADARAQAYAAVNGISFRGCHFRRDIGNRPRPGTP